MQLKHYSFLLIIIVSLCSCLSSMITGANIIYDRHQVYKKSTDLALAAKVGHAIKTEPSLNCPSNKCFEIAVFHGDVLLLGVVPTPEAKTKATVIAQTVGNYRHLYNFIAIDPQYTYPEYLNDHWITTQIRAKIMANADIDPQPFKIISKNNIVYIMGDVMDYQETAIKDICRTTPYVEKVINLLQVYSLKKQERKMIPNTPTPAFPNTHLE